jgi:NAD(P)-dependent dehydrogenase (short-subunit alcohol dehydrogenase family)
MTNFNVNGKVAIVTGGTRGLGLYCAEALVENGASTVVITSRKANACEEAKKYLEKVAADKKTSTKIIAIAADLAVEQDVLDFAEKVKSQIDRLDILIANAGASWGSPFNEHPISAMKKVLTLNIVGVFQTIQVFGSLLEKSGSVTDPSRVIVMSSVIALNPYEPVGTYGYLASKAGVTHMAKNLALQLGPKNITVNCLAPGFFPTKMANGMIEAAGDILVDTNPRQRLGEKEDIQAATIFLCSKQANYINGAVLPIDGGAHLGPASKF